MKKIVAFIKNVFDTLGKCVVPAVPVLIGAGMLKALLIIVGPGACNLLGETNSTYLVLSFVAEAGYYFLPIYIAIASAEVFNTNKYMAALMGAVLLSPEFVNYVNIDQQLSIFNLPVALTNYGNQILPSVIIVFIQSYVYKFLNKIISEKIRNIFVPLLTILIMAPISLCVIGPLGVVLCEYLTQFVLWLSQIGPLGNAIFTAIIPFIVIFGLSGANLAALLALASIGPDPICFFGNVIFNTVLGIATLGVYFSDKKSETLAAAIAASIGGSSEASIFGIMIKDYRKLLALCCGCFVSGLLTGIFKVKTFTVSSFGIFGIISTIGEGSSIILAAISIITGSAISFILCFFINKKEH